MQVWHQNADADPGGGACKHVGGKVNAGPHATNVDERRRQHADGEGDPGT
jgi:hypothetical protein